MLALNKELCLLIVSCVSIPFPKYTRSPKHLEDVAFHVLPLVLGPKDEGNKNQDCTFKLSLRLDLHYTVAQVAQIRPVT